MERQTAIALHEFAMKAGDRFDEHVHDDHQLAWVRDGVLMVTVGERHWMLPPTLALWIPAGTPHTTSATRTSATMQGVYVTAGVVVPWDEPTVVGVPPLLREVIGRLCRDDLDDDARERTERIVPDLLEPVHTLTIDVPMPVDVRGARIAEALATDPGDERDLAAWGRHVGASSRTLSRIFPAETGMGFAQWRSRLRVRASLGYLADGESVSTTAALVGFASASAFIAAFTRLTGTTPGAYFADSVAGGRHEMA